MRERRRGRGGPTRGRGRAVSGRGQSETLGFATVFALVLLVLVVVSTAIYPAMQDARSRQNVENVERGFALFAGNVEDLARHRAPSRSTRLRLSGGRLSLGDPVTVAVEGTNVSNASDNFSVVYDARPLVYRSPDGAELAYASGGVVRDDGHGVVMLTEPPLVISDEQVVLTVVQLEPAGRTNGVGGRSTARVRAVRTDTRVAASEQSEHDVTITITSPRAEAWRRTLADEQGVTCSGTDDETTCSVTTDRIQVVVVRVAVGFV